ncbi:MAG: lactate utilization protein [Anaerolineaceae bacterium]|nr:lactate utilization protein [Chloroflexota bacterium]MCY4008812.1 lactate utilization protein [Anaerolineaceae bacterium]
MASSNPSREAILNRLRKAQSAGTQLGFEAPPTPAEYEAVRTVENEPASLLLQFSQALEQLRAHAHVVDDEEEAVSALMDVLRRHEADAVIGWAESELPLSNLPAVLASAGVEYHRPLGDAQRFAEAVVGISGAEALLAATGTVVVRSGAGRGRIPTVLAPVYVVLAHVDQLLPNIEAWVEKTGPALGDRGNICFITGPSKTGDIEMILVHGVHGPGEVHVILMR